MDLLPFLLAILAAGVVIGGLIWYRARRHRTTKKPARTKQPKQTEQSIDKIATTTSRKIAKAQTTEEAFAAGREGLNRIKEQIKGPKYQKRRRK